MTAHTDTPNVGVQPTPTAQPTPTRLTFRERGAHLAQPSPPAHAQGALWAFRVAIGFWATAVLVDRAGAQPEGVAGIVLGVGALGVSIAYAHAHDRSAHAHLGGAE